MALYLIVLILNDQTEEEGAWNGLLAITAKSHIVVENFKSFMFFFSQIYDQKFVHTSFDNIFRAGRFT